MSSKTRVTTFGKLNDKSELGVVLGRLMLALNDIGIANDALGAWMKDQEGIRKDRQRGAKMYFVRMLISHVFEALTVINKIANMPELVLIVEQSAQPTRDAFHRCLKVIGTDKYKTMKELRSGLGFHYLDKPVRDAIASQPGDRIVDSAVVRGIFKIPESADVQKELDRLIHDIQKVGDDLAEFAGYFIMENAT